MSIPYRLDPFGERCYLRRLQYIESSGTQYIDLGIETADKDFEADFQCTIAGTLSAGMTSFGRYASASRTGYDVQVYTGALYFLLGTGTGASGYKLTNQESRTQLKLSGLSLYENGDLVKTFSARSYANAGTFCLFGLPTFIPRNLYTRIYSMKIRDSVNLDLVLNLIPVLDYAGTPCLYDSISKTFKYNQGTGSFNYA